MPHSDTYVSSLFPSNANKGVVRARVLTPFESASLDHALRADAGSFYYSAWISFLDALNGINDGFYTWATVKLYYTVFYSFRASLAIDSVCIFYVGRSAYILNARGGHAPTSVTDPGTHKAVLRQFQRVNPSHTLLSQQIDLKSAVDWLMDQRELANYRQNRFTEPNPPTHFDYVRKLGVRKSLIAYMADRSFAYTFDPDHAMLAYPLCALSMIGSQLLSAALPAPSEHEGLFLTRRAQDHSGPIAPLVGELRRLNLLPAS